MQFKTLLVLTGISLTGIVQAQYNSENHVVTLSKYHLKPLSEVEGGSAEERKEVLEENAKKMNALKTKLVSSTVLGHFWTGKTGEVLVVNEWASLDDADATILSNSDLRDKAWRKEEDRKKHVEKFGKYWVGKHTDVGIYELDMKKLKRPSRQYKDDTFVSMTKYYLAPLSNVEEGSAEERKEILQTWFDNVIKKNEKVLSHMELGHYWSGSAGGPDGWPVIMVNEYATMEDALDEDVSDLVETAWPNEEERKAFRKKFRAYWSNGKHEDLGLHNNWVDLRKN
ncbi:MAG: hypothetical protein HOD97_04665 [Candidatus Marinimicrobia bacterium]|nr:hypothetical protein [Candidatus Neomarinimicrobiota bacterium]MBT3618140.1 hypothetical protein [Candidatus Neomarinimicrobiota bacterium]MBT3828611.1 hypothetical protein [Candidatus Neomarinimicrobiota bacterium]MBT3996927.1 hypothetical protein [Candidatus Neomarinimicrobiota bacterium]MBT4280891.1 hypothetical protein [Candidatus Neomarinimicrobiota bacterium]